MKASILISSSLACSVVTSGPDDLSCKTGMALPPNTKYLDSPWRSQRHTPLLGLRSLEYAYSYYDYKDTQLEGREPDLYLRKCSHLPVNWLQNAGMPSRERGRGHVAHCELPM